MKFTLKPATEFNTVRKTIVRLVIIVALVVEYPILLACLGGCRRMVAEGSELGARGERTPTRDYLGTTTSSTEPQTNRASLDAKFLQYKSITAINTSIHKVPDPCFKSCRTRRRNTRPDHRLPLLPSNIRCLGSRTYSITSSVEPRVPVFYGLPILSVQISQIEIFPSDFLHHLKPLQSRTSPNCSDRTFFLAVLEPGATCTGPDKTLKKFMSMVVQLCDNLFLGLDSLYPLLLHLINLLEKIPERIVR